MLISLPSDLYRKSFQVLWKSWVYLRLSNLCVWDRLPWSSPTFNPMRPRRMCMRWACFLVWVNNITWSWKVRVRSAAQRGRQEELGEKQFSLHEQGHDTDCYESGEEKRGNAIKWKIRPSITCNHSLSVSFSSLSNPDKFLSEVWSHISVTVHKDSHWLLQWHWGQILYLHYRKTHI